MILKHSKYSVMTIIMYPLTLTTLTPTDNATLPMIECWQPYVAACWAPENTLTIPPEGAKKRAWISSGLTKEGVKVWRSLASDEEILQTKPTWKPLHEFKY
mgnify:CR=1 FL=1